MIVVVGNGKSRAVLNLSLLDNHITYGCNAFYRDYSPTYLICGDSLMMWEILKSDYTLTHQCFFKMFDKLDGMYYETLVGMSGSKVFEYPEQRTDKFVMYGHKDETAIYWVRPEEQTEMLEWWGDGEDNSYTSGTAAMKLASLHHPTEDIYCIGFDYYLDRTADNIYIGSKNYLSNLEETVKDWKRKEGTEFDRTNWLKQHERIESNHQGKIYHVGKHLNYYEFEELLNS